MCRQGLAGGGAASGAADPKQRQATSGLSATLDGALALLLEGGQQKQLLVLWSTARPSCARVALRLDPLPPHTHSHTDQCARPGEQVGLPTLLSSDSGCAWPIAQSAHAHRRFTTRGEALAVCRFRLLTALRCRGGVVGIAWGHVPTQRLEVEVLSAHRLFPRSVVCPIDPSFDGKRPRAGSARRACAATGFHRMSLVVPFPPAVPVEGQWRTSALFYLRRCL